MDITTYLPDAIGAQAKEAGLPFSRLLRSAVEAELARRVEVIRLAGCLADATDDWEEVVEALVDALR